MTITSKLRTLGNFTDLITSDERGSVKLVERTVVKDFYKITQASVSIRTRRIKVLIRTIRQFLIFN